MMNVENKAARLFYEVEAEKAGWSVLDSFIVANTPSHEMKKLWGLDKATMQARHIVFQEEDKDSYIGAMLRRSMTA